MRLRRRLADFDFRAGRGFLFLSATSKIEKLRWSGVAQFPCGSRSALPIYILLRIQWALVKALHWLSFLSKLMSVSSVV